MKNKAYLEGRVKLLEAGGKVIQQNGGGQKKWQAKAESKGYNAGSDFVDKHEGKKKRQKRDD